MLRDSWRAVPTDQSIEQLEIEFIDDISSEEIANAWTDIVAQTAALKMAFFVENDYIIGWREVSEIGSIQTILHPIGTYSEWLAKDRNSLLLQSGKVPWHIHFLPNERRWIWTFHHALLDGRSISKIIIQFLMRLLHGTAPSLLALSSWVPQSVEEITYARNILTREFHKIIPPVTVSFSPASGKTLCTLGSLAANNLDQLSDLWGVTASTILTWSWGQAVMRASRGAFAIVEQLRCGAPQAATAGFTMNTIPFVIQRASIDPMEHQLLRFSQKLLELRSIETTSPDNLPREVLELTKGSWSSVIMTDHATLDHQVSSFPKVKSIALHEYASESLTAAAWKSPNLHLEVEGPENHKLVHYWAEEITALLLRASITRLPHPDFDTAIL
jgi:hypothetical protein